MVAVQLADLFDLSPEQTADMQQTQQQHTA